jgi:hypothetical protein
MNIPPKAIFAIAKSLHHANAAKFYFEQSINEIKATFGDKKLLSDLARRADSIVRDMLMRVPDGQVKEILKDEIKDPLAIDAFSDTFIQLSLENRTKAEDFLNHLISIQIAKAHRVANGYTEDYEKGVIQGENHFKELIAEKEAELSIIKREYDFFCKQLKPTEYEQA